VQDKEKPSRIVQELCKKLKLQLDELGVALEEEPQSEEHAHRKDLFKALQQQLNDLSR
jgi:hypothetical protein